MTLPAEYRNQPGDRITVAPVTWPPRLDMFDGAGRRVVARRAWSVWTTRHGRTRLHVVTTDYGMTVVDRRGRMVTCWHCGITPGDLARLTLRGPRADQAEAAA